MAAESDDHAGAIHGGPTGEAIADSDIRYRPAVKALVTEGDRVLFVEEHHADGDPFWTLPGGGMVEGESPRCALQRELREELGVDSRVGELVGACSYRHRSDESLTSMYLVFIADLLSAPVPNRRDGIRAFTWAKPKTPPTGLLPTFETWLSSNRERFQVSQRPTTEVVGLPVDSRSADSASEGM